MPGMGPEEYNFVIGSAISLGMALSPEETAPMYNDLIRIQLSGQQGLREGIWKLALGTAQENKCPPPVC